ncbi:MAG: 50S ribosomal protein L21 [Candidatus Pacebacteria bacterium]|nr:50S ribosomal protein L21 [Candidatus Paceibacterota bacterium]
MSNAKWAILKFQGKQYKVKEGDELDLANIDLEEGKEIKFEQILVLVQDDKIAIGQPMLSKVVVQGKVIGHQKGKKIRVATYRAKSRYRRVKGFRSRLTRVRIEKIIN